MKLILTFYGALCETKTFKINGIDAEYEDFGVKGDTDRDNAEPYGCGNMRFERISPTKKALKKYKISESEYSEICNKLEAGLSFGRCGWCV